MAEKKTAKQEDERIGLLLERHGQMLGHIYEALENLQEKVEVMEEGLSASGLGRKLAELAELGNAFRQYQQAGFGRLEELGGRSAELARTRFNGLYRFLNESFQRQKLDTEKLGESARSDRAIFGQTLQESLARLESLLGKVGAASQNRFEAFSQTVNLGLQRLEDALGTVRGEFQSLDTRVKQLQESLAKIGANSRSRFENFSRAITNGLESLEGSLGNLEKENAALDARIKQLQEQISKNAANSQNKLDNFIQAISQTLARIDEGLSQLALDSGSRYGNLFNSVNTGFQRFEEGIGRLSADSGVRYGNLYQTINTANNAIERLQGDLRKETGDISNNLLNYQGQLADMRSRDEANAGSLSELQARLSDISRQLTDKQDQIRDLNASLAQKEKELAEEKGRLAGLRLEKDNALKEAEHKAQRQVLVLKAQEERIASLINVVSDKEKENAKLQARRREELASNEAIRENVKAELELIRSELAPYASLRDALVNSPTFAQLASENGMDEAGDLGLLACSRALAQNPDFPLKVYNSAKKAREGIEKPQPMSEDEQRVYAELNHFYRKAWNIEFDLFQLPGRQGMGETFQAVPFSEGEVESLENPGERDKKYTVAVYVPGLRNRLGGNYRSALARVANEKP